MGTATNEVEIKFAVADVAALNARLSSSGFRLITPPTLETNTLFDFAGGRLRSAGEVLRIRTYSGKGTLTHKSPGQTGRHKVRAETETSVSDPEKLAAIFRSLGLQPVFRYEKYRAEWQQGEGHVVVDQTPIGDFAEIEGPAEWIDSTARALGVAPAHYITDSYLGLFSDWKQRTGSAAADMTFAAIPRDMPGHTPPA